MPRCLEDQLRELLHYEAADRRVGREEARLLYVGFTRARDQLIAVQPLKSARNGTTTPQSLEWLIQVGAATNERMWHAWNEPFRFGRLSARRPPARRWNLRRLNGIFVRSRRSKRRNSGICSRASSPPIRTGSPRSRWLPIAGPDRTAGRSRDSDGRDRYDASQHLALRSPGSENVTGRARQILGRHGMETVVPHPEQIGAMAEWLFGWLEREYGPARKIWHERPIRMWCNGQELNGSIDLVWETAPPDV